MTNYSNMGGYSLAAYTYVYSHHICLLQFIKEKIILKTNKKNPGCKCEGYTGMVAMNPHLGSPKIPLS